MPVPSFSSIFDEDDDTQLAIRLIGVAQTLADQAAALTRHGIYADRISAAARTVAEAAQELSDVTAAYGTVESISAGSHKELSACPICEAERDAEWRETKARALA